MPSHQTKEGEKHCTASVYIISRELPRRVLLVHHKKFDMWVPPGGHKEPHENFYETAIREVKEEVGIDIMTYLSAPQILDDHACLLGAPAFILEERIAAHGNQPEHFHLDITYIVKIPFQRAVHGDESHAIGWFTLEETQDLPIFTNVRKIIETIFKEEY